jgi:hypothetical protein
MPENIQTPFGFDWTAAEVIDASHRPPDHVKARRAQEQGRCAGIRGRGSSIRRGG